MLEMLKERKAALEAQGKKGFTLMEMLIVIAIIAVLIAIAIPIFTSQLEQSREATDKSNLRSAYAEVVATYLTNNSTASVTVPAQQKEAGWQSEGGSSYITIGTELKTSASGVSASNGEVSNVPAKTSGVYSVSIDASGKVTIS